MKQILQVFVIFVIQKSAYNEISMCTIVHTQENYRTWIGFAELAKGSVPCDRNIKNY
jgi:hypothetical protein